MTSWTSASPPDERVRRDKLTELRLLEERARRDARKSLPSFVDYVYALEPAPHHRLMLSALQAVYTGTIDRLLIIAPPGHAKSTYTSIVFPSWYLGHRYNESIIGVTTTDRLGKLYGDTIRNAIEGSPEWRSVFPGVQPDTKRGWTSDGFFLRGPERRGRQSKDPQLVYTGAGGPVIGRRAGGVIIDDAVDEATARSETLLEQRKLWIRRSVFSRLKPGGWRIIAGTLWAEGDVVDSAMQSGNYVTLHMAAQSSGELVEADVTIPDGVKWRPEQPYREVRDDSLARVGS